MVRPAVVARRPAGRQPGCPSTRPYRSPRSVTSSATLAVPDHAVLLTGATGFVGMELLARYLERSERHVVALVRAGDDSQATARVRDTFAAAGGDPAALRGRVTALA